MNCIKCNFEKEDKKQCKNCKKTYMIKYNEINKEKLSLHKKKLYNKNRDKVCEKSKLYYYNNAERLNLLHKEYAKKHKLEKNKRKRDRLSSDIYYKIRCNCSYMIWKALKGKKNKLSILKYLPYTIEELKQHLESKFDNKMNWDNYGNYWHIDHIYPQSKLLYTSMVDENFKKCWALDNLQPLEAIENIKKYNKINYKGVFNAQ